MSRENEEIVRRILDGWAVGDFRAGLAYLDPDVALVTPPELIESGVFVGHEQLADYTRRFMSQYKRVTIAATADPRGVGEAVIVSVDQVGEGRTSGIDMRFSYFMVFTVTEGRVVRVESVMDEAAARAAAELSS